MQEVRDELKNIVTLILKEGRTSKTGSAKQGQMMQTWEIRHKEVSVR